MIQNIKIYFKIYATKIIVGWFWLIGRRSSIATVQLHAHLWREVYAGGALRHAQGGVGKDDRNGTQRNAIPPKHRIHRVLFQ